MELSWILKRGKIMVHFKEKYTLSVRKTKDYLSVQHMWLLYLNI
jgi:hypothetical protein